jgi:hypothetical protein
MHQIFRERRKIEEIIRKLKKLKQDATDLQVKDALIIALFVLEVGIFEHRFKNLVYKFWLGKLLNNLNNEEIKNFKTRDKFLDRTTLGGAKEIFKKNLKVISTKIHITPIWNEKYLRSFVKAVEYINQLRRDLYHDLYKKGKSLKRILNKIEGKIEFANKKYYIEEGRDSPVSKSLISNGKIPNNWMIEMMIEITLRLFCDLLIKEKKIKVETKYSWLSLD